MATKKITELTELAATPADDDVFLVHDLSAGVDKKVKMSNLSPTVTASVLTESVTGGLSYSGWLPGTTTWNQRIQDAGFHPSMLNFMIRAELRSADDLVLIQTDFRMNLVVPRVVVDSTNGGLCYLYHCGRYNSVTGGYSGDVDLIFDNSLKTGDSPTAYDFVTTQMQVAASTYVKLYGRFWNDAAIKGAEWWMRRVSDSDFIDLNEVGGFGEGYTQMIMHP